jgi:hypothetical protein
MQTKFRQRGTHKATHSLVGTWALQGLLLYAFQAMKVQAKWEFASSGVILGF